MFQDRSFTSSSVGHVLSIQHYWISIAPTLPIQSEASPDNVTRSSIFEPIKICISPTPNKKNETKEAFFNFLFSVIFCATPLYYQKRLSIKFHCPCSDPSLKLSPEVLTLVGAVHFSRRVCHVFFSKFYYPVLSQNLLASW